MDQVITALVEFLSKTLDILAPVFAKIILGLIPLMIAIHIVIIIVTFWRRDNREDGNPPFSGKLIREKVYHVGKWWGLSTQLLGQPIIYALMGVKFDLDVSLLYYDNLIYFVTSLVMVVAAWFMTGYLSRLTFDAWVIWAAGHKKVRMYKWLTVEHRPPGSPASTKTTYLPPELDRDQEDKTQ